MKKLFAVLLLFFLSEKITSQSLGCLTPTLVFSDPTQTNNPVVSSTISCDFAGYVRIRTTPVLNASTGTITQGNAPCIRVETSLTNANSNTNNSMVLYEGGVSTGTVCSTCGVSIPSNSLFTLYWPGLEPSQQHDIALCHNAAAANMTYTVYSCYSNVILNSGVWSNAGAAGCQTVTIPANTAIGTASYVITPTVPAAAVVDNYGSGYITLDPWQMAPGTYTVTYNFNSQNGCTTSATRTLLITNPYNTGNTNFTAPTNLCPYSSCVSLTTAITGYQGSFAFPFFSGTGVSSNSFCPSSSGAGTFPVTLEVGPTAVCGKTITNNVTVNPLPNPGAATTASYTCNNPSTATLTASGGGTYNWTGPSVISGANTATAVVGPSTGNYTVTVTSAVGCTAQAVTQVVVNNTSVNVTPNAASNVINCSATQATLSVSPMSGVTYSWSGPGISGSTTGSAITATAGGSYTVVVTNTVNGCKTNTTTITATQNTTISNTPSSSGSVGCAASAITLSTTANGVYNYTWTAPAGATLTSGSNGQTATANATSGSNFSITVFNTVNQCSNTAVIAPAVNQTPPTVNAASPSTVTCISSAVTLTTSASSVTYTWVAPSGSSISGGGNTSSASGTGGGSYTLFVTSTANQCTNSAVAAVTTQTTKPAAPAITNNPTLTCTNTLVTITSAGGAGLSYNWSGPGISGSSTNANVNATAPGVYSLAVTSTSNGCTSTAPSTVSITQNTTAPVVGPVGSSTALAICNSTTAFTGSATPANSNPTWLGGVVSGANTYTAAVSNPGGYTLVATNPANGCSASATFSLINSTGPQVNLSSTSATVTCSNPIVQTIASTTSSPVSYNWSGPGILGSATSATLNANLSGVYTVTVMNTTTNCTVSASFNVAANNSSVTPNATASNTVNCTASSATISTNPSPAGTFTYNWSNSATTSSILVSPTVNATYVVTVTNTNNGCTGSQTVNVIASTTPPSNVNTTASSVTLSCLNPNTVLTGSATGANTYSWIAPGNNVVATTATANVNTPGTYSFIAVGANGCASAASAAQVTVVADVNAPSPVLSNSTPSIVCNNQAVSSTTVTGSNMTGATFSWSPASGVSSPTSNVVSFNAPGSYTCVVTGTNGCTSPTVVSVGTATNSPSPVAGTATAQALGCTNTIVTIAPTFTDNNLSYTWSGSGIVGSSNSSSVQVNQSGTYTLTVTNTLTGCSNSVSPLTVTVTGSSVPPTVTVTSSSTIGIGCQPNTSTITLSSQASSAVSYTWSNGANTSSISTSVPGVYTLSVTDVNNGCTASTTFTVDNNSTAPTLTSSAVASLPCGGGTTSLTAVSSNTNVSFSWTGNGIVSGSNTASPVINQPGVYTVTATDAITGCTSSSTVGIVQTTVSALAAADVTVGPAPLTVNFSNQSLGATSYSWSLGDGSSSVTNAPSNTYANAGSYTVVLIATNGACSDSDTLIIKVQSALGVIPEVFTPNSDGHNDVFVIQGIDSYPNNNFQVFNRWGNPVYSAKPYKNDWDGSPNAQGATGSGKLPTGTYYYMLELGDKDKTTFKGFIQIQY